MTTPAEPMRVERVTLEGAHVRLEPLSLEHLDALCEIALDPDLWRWTVAQVHDRDSLRRYIENALREESAGTALPFATVERSGGRVLGSTRYGAIDLRSRRVEIGWTFVGRAWQRSAVNTEAKYLMIRHAFERLGCHRVELKTDALNARSRAAILRIGAVEEGTLRRHTVTETGRVRDTVYFGITDEEWPAVRERLERRLAR